MKRRMAFSVRTRSVTFSLALSLVCAAPAFAQDAAATSTEADRAKMLFNSGAQAFSAGQFAAAIQAFAEAHRILPRPAIVYSLAQAHRRQYFITRNKEHLRAAITNFHAYIDQVPDGGRRADAAQALSELEPLAARVDLSASAAPQEKEPARLMITTQPSGASFTIDGKERKQTPYAAEVSPGKHRVHLALEGYFEEDREVLAVDRTLVPIAVELRERPSRLVVSAPSGCEVSIDGRPAGITPLTEPPELSAGTHLIVVTKSGYKAFSQDIEFRRAERKTVNVALEPTGQRLVARTLLFSGGALVLAGGAFSLLALERQNAFLDIQERQGKGEVFMGDEQDLSDAKASRGRWTTAAVAAFSVAGAALATGVVFYVFDRPVVMTPRARPEDRRPRPTGPVEPTEMSMVPLVGPSFGGAALTGRF